MNPKLDWFCWYAKKSEKLPWRSREYVSPALLLEVTRSGRRPLPAPQKSQVVKKWRSHSVCFHFKRHLSQSCSGLTSVNDICYFDCTVPHVQGRRRQKWELIVRKMSHRGWGPCVGEEKTRSNTTNREFAALILLLIKSQWNRSRWFSISYLLELSGSTTGQVIRGYSLVGSVQCWYRHVQLCKTETLFTFLTTLFTQFRIG